MAGLLDPTDAALMALGTGLLGGGNFSQAFGRGGQAALSTYAAMAQAQQEQAQREKEFALRELLGKAQLENYASEAAQRKAQTEALAQKERAAQQRLLSLPAIFGQAVPGDANMPGAPASGQFNPIAAMQSGWGVDDIPKLQNMPNLGRPKVARTIETMVNGRPVQQQLDEYGQPVGDPLAQWKAPNMTDLGGKVVGIDPVTGAQIMELPKTQTPDGKASNALGWANNSIAQGNLNLSRERLAFDQNQPKGQYDAERGVLVDPRTGAATPVTMDGQPVGAKNKELTDAQSKALLFGSRAQESNNIIAQMGAQGINRPGLIKGMAESVPMIGGGLGTMANITQSAEQQKVEQAQRDFVNSILRRESGAVISPSEFDNAQKQYFPQIGDSQAVIKQKAANRDLAIRGIMAEVPQNKRDLGSSGAPAAPSDPSQLKNNGRYTLPNGEVARWDSMKRKFVTD